MVRVNHDIAKRLIKYTAYPGDVVVTKVGFLGYSTVLTNEYDKYIYKREITRICPIDKEYLNPYYLSTFFNTDHGRKQALRFSSGMTRDRVLIENQKLFIIPIKGEKFQSIIEKTVKEAYHQKEKSNSYIDKAKNIMLLELGLIDYSPKHTLSYVQNYLDVQKAERMDAEYFQPKYEEIERAIKNSDEFFTLSDIASYKKGVEVGSKEYIQDDENVPFIRVSNISPDSISEEKYITHNLYSLLQKYQPQKDEILLSKDGSPGIAYHIYETPKPMIVSGGILRLKIERSDISPEYLCLVLNSITTQSQIERSVGGSIIKHWRPDEVSKTLIPIIEKEKRDEITNLIIESREAKKKSDRLLEISKLGVEKAIEQDEDIAIRWMKKEIESLGVSIDA
jgi:restriction endonuclease S subunit